MNSIIKHKLADETEVVVIHNVKANLDNSIFINQPVLINKEFIEIQINDLIKPPDPFPHKDILIKLIEKIEAVDFKEKSGIVDKKEPKNNHLLIIVNEHIQALAKKHNWGICKNNCFIYLYNAAYWSQLGVEELKGFLGEAAEKMSLDKFKARYYSFRDNLYKQFMSSAFLPKPEISKESVLINLQNGTFEITPQGNRLREFQRQDFVTYQLPFEYNPNAKALMFQAFLDEVLDDKSLQMVLAEYLGYVFIPHSYFKFEKALLLYGDGSNGKSVIFEIVNALLGRENTSNYSLQSLTDKDGYYRAMLANKLVNYGTEINGRLETSYFKQLVSGEPVEARLPFEKPFILDHYAKLIFNCNKLPFDVEHTHAYFRRLLIIPFKVIILDDKQDVELAKKIIKSELSGIFNWVLEGLNRLLIQKKFSESEAMKLQIQEYKKNSDSVKLFLDEKNYSPDPSNKELIKSLYADYRIFCQEDGFKPVNKINFKQRLLSFGIVIEKKNVGFVAFVSINENDESIII